MQNDELKNYIAANYARMEKNERFLADELLQRLEAEEAEDRNRQIDYRILSDNFTEVLAKGMHYFESQESINTLKTAREVLESVDGGTKRYMVDPIYRARVRTLVAHLLDVTRKNMLAASPQVTGKK